MIIFTESLLKKVSNCVVKMWPQLKEMNFITSPVKKMHFWQKINKKIKIVCHIVSVFCITGVWLRKIVFTHWAHQKKMSGQLCFRSNHFRKQFHESVTNFLILTYCHFAKKQKLTEETFSTELVQIMKVKLVTPSFLS